MSDDNVFGMLERTGGGESKAAYIVDSSYSEDSWYRVWSDGFIEQGGETESEQTSTVTFPIAFTSVPYVNAASKELSSSGTGVIVFIREITSTNVKFYGGGWQSSTGVISSAIGRSVKKWFACGY